MEKAKRKIPLPFLPALGAILLALTGCIRVEQTLVLNKNGSGIIDLTYGISEESAIDMKMVAQAMSPDAADAAMPFDFSEEDIRKDFKEYEPFGVFLQSVRTRSKDGWKYRNLVISFRDLQGLARTGFLSDRNISLARDSRGNYVFLQSAGADGKMSREMAALTEAPDSFVEQLMEGFKMIIRIKPPGRILEANATRSDQNSATWVFDFDKDPSVLKKVQSTSMRLVFEGSGLEIPEFRSQVGTRR